MKWKGSSGLRRASESVMVLHELFENEQHPAYREPPARARPRSIPEDDKALSEEAAASGQVR